MSNSNNNKGIDDYFLTCDNSLKRNKMHHLRDYLPHITNMTKSDESDIRLKERMRINNKQRQDTYHCFHRFFDVINASGSQTLNANTIKNKDSLFNNAVLRKCFQYNQIKSYSNNSKQNIINDNQIQNGALNKNNQTGNYFSSLNTVLKMKMN